MTENKYKGTIHSFWSLLKDYNIEIPIIQRDYAQGREEQQELRQRFFSALYSSLKDEKPIKLDFVYGSKDDQAFLPLDGQQRLTSLYLLHWYAALKDGKLTESAEILKKFSYETRASSREFCWGLISSNIEFEISNEKLSHSIINSNWFFLSWQMDPTIEAMLRAIDDIDQKFREIDDLWEKLTASPCLIEFYHVELEDIGLTDDLYIKMNARGKLLTPFENFKATFQKYVKDQGWEEAELFQQTFAYKIDGAWTDLFWNHRKNDKIDESFMRLISTVAMLSFSTERSSDRLITILRLQNNPDFVRAENFTEAGFRYLIKCLDLYSRFDFNKNKIQLQFTLWQHESNEGIFSGLINENASYSQKVLFYAQTEYLLNVEVFDFDKFQDWMRVIRNLISRGDVTRSGDRPAIVRSPATFDGMINLVKELSSGCADIYTFLKETRIKSSFAKDQTNEERKKAKLIVKNPEFKQSIFSAEDTNLFMGKIEFVLNCCGYFNSDVDELNIEKFDKVVKIVNTHFDKEITNKIRRGLLATPSNINAYDYYTYWWSYSFAVDSHKRCLIDKFREIEYFIYGDYKDKYYYVDIFKRLIDKLIVTDIDTFLETFNPPNSMPNWQKRLIKESNLLDQCKSNYIAIPEDESCCYLLPTKRPRDIEACICIN